MNHKQTRTNSLVKLALLGLSLCSPVGIGAVEGSQAGSKSDPAQYTVAVFPFLAGDEKLKELGPQVTLLVNTYLSNHSQLALVERAEIDRITGEIELGISGTVSPATAARIGHLTGAKVLVTGSAFTVQNELFLVSKIIGTETSVVFAEMVTIPITESHSAASRELASRIAGTIIGKGAALTASKQDRQGGLEELKAKFKREKLPVVSVAIQERHAGRRVLDPAAEIEIGSLVKELGFSLIDQDTSTTRADLQITGEAFSEFGMRLGNLVSCKARLEIKVKKRATGEIIAIDRQTEVAVDISEQIAGKMAVQKAAQEIAQRIVPKIFGAL